MPSMKTINFNKLGEELKVELTFIGLITASYEFTVWAADSNDKIMHESGNNQNSQDDIYKLPVPIAQNDNRIIQLRTEFVGLDPINSKQFKIKIAVYQGTHIVGECDEEGEVNSKMQGSLIYAKLKGE